MEKTLKNNTKNRFKSFPVWLVFASLLAYFIAPTLAMAATFAPYPLISQEINTSTVNSTPSTGFGVNSGNSLPGEFISESPESKIFRGLPAPGRVVSGLVTAYSSTPDQTDASPFIAASGKHVYDGMIAANGYPFGTKIKIPALFGDKIFTVDDRMNSRYGNKNFDVWMNAPRHTVDEFGAKRAEVEIYYPAQELASK